MQSFRPRTIHRNLRRATRIPFPDSLPGWLQANNARRTDLALEAVDQFVLCLIPTVDKFFRSQKFVLGDRIEAAALDALIAAHLHARARLHSVAKRPSPSRFQAAAPGAAQATAK